VSNALITCTSWDCPERRGEVCTCAAVVQKRDISAAEILFLSESNNIDNMWANWCEKRIPKRPKSKRKEKHAA